ncbi:MAG: pilus assembly protein PilM [Dehalococcoidia bacterium]
MAKKATTLYITDTGINLLVMKGKQVDKWASLPLEPGLVRQGLIVDEEQVADRVKQLFKETGVQPKKVTAGLSGFDSLYRIITLPDLPEAVLPEAVRREAQRTMPTRLEEVYFSYQSIPATKERRFFLATFPRNLTDALVRTLHQAGVKPYFMDLAPLAVCRIPNQPRAIVVNVRLEHFDVMVISDRIPEVIRTLSLPGEVESLEDKLPFIAEEFTRTVTFYNSTHLERPLDSSVPVLICGDLAEAPETWPALVGETGYSVSPLPSPVAAPEGFNPNEFMVNIGLALKELPLEKEATDSSLVNFNALPEAYIPPSFSIARVLIPVGIVIGIGLVVLGGVLVLHNRARIEELRPAVTTAESRVTQQQRDVTALRAEVTSTEEIGDTLHDTITALQRDRATMHEDLQEIYRLAGERVTLSSVGHSGGSVSLSGSGPTVDAAYAYARALRNSGRFSVVWIPSVSEAGSFSISLTK